MSQNGIRSMTISCLIGAVLYAILCFFLGWILTSALWLSGFGILMLVMFRAKDTEYPDIEDVSCDNRDERQGRF